MVSFYVVVIGIVLNLGTRNGFRRSTPLAFKEITETYANYPPGILTRVSSVEVEWASRTPLHPERSNVRSYV